MATKVHKGKRGKPLRIAVNGFGRIGRAVARGIIERKSALISLAAINDHGSPEELRDALEFDSNYGRLGSPVVRKGSVLHVDGTKVQTFLEDDPSKLPWKKHAIDIVIESTGKFTRRQDALQHIKAGAKQVILSTYPHGSHAYCPLAGVAPLDKPDTTFITHASCTTTAVAPVLNLIRKRVGIQAASLFGVQSVTHSQTVVDKTRGQGRRRRSALQNIIPVEVDARHSIPALVPGMNGRFIASAARVPSPIVHLAILNVVVKKKITVEKINQLFTEAEKSVALKGILATTDDPVVSQDLKQHPASGIIDLNMTQVAAGILVQLGVWYDNEWAFSQRLIDLLEKIGSKNAS